MRFRDPIAPQYGQLDTKQYVKKFAWFPMTTHDGYAIWLEDYWYANDYGWVSKIKFLTQRKRG